MLKKNDEREGTVVSLGMDGEGVLYVDGTTLFVPFVLPNEKIRYHVLKVSNNCAFGKVIDIIEKSLDRVDVNCPVFCKCGGCQLQHLKYKKQLEVKNNKVKNCFNKVAGIDVNILPAVSSKNEFRYRNKLQLPVCETEKGTVIGFYAENSHRIIPIKDCIINPEWTKDIIDVFTEFFKVVNITGYNEQTFSGDVREITVKEVSNHLIITVVILKNCLPQVKLLIDMLKEKLKLNFSLFLNVNTRKSNVIYGDEFILAYGEPNIKSEMLGIKYTTGVQSFMQVNTDVCKKLYSKVSDIIKEYKNATIIEAYSGAGVMTAILARNAKKAIGIEIVKEASDMANIVAKDNNLQKKITNYCGKCEDWLPRIVKKEREEGNEIIVVLDPPRKGCDIKVISSLIENKIDKIIYISCKPSTLARDVGLLVGTLSADTKGITKTKTTNPQYNIELVQPFDMFAQTKHVETLVVLSRVI